MADRKSINKTDPTVLLAKIRQEFPELSRQSYDYVTTGGNHEVIILDAAMVFRFPNDAEYLASLADEVKLLHQLAPLLPANVPDYTYVASDSSFAGYPIVPGQKLTQAVFTHLDEPTKAKITTQLAQLLSSLHAASQTGLDLASVEPSYMPSEHAEVKRLAATYLNTALDAAEYAIVQTILADIDTVLAQGTPALFIHGDIWSDHLLWDASQQRLGLIDFSDTTIADPAIDFAELYEYGQLFVQAVYDRYTGPKDDGFLQRAWAYQRWTSVYLMTDHFVYQRSPFAEARQTFDRVKAGLADQNHL